jgi:phage shock protein A
MGAISRLRYVIAANVNALLEKAEDPEKLLRALIREMEDASEDARVACADLLAEQAHLERLEGRFSEEGAEWQRRAENAVADGRDDLARAALKARQEADHRHKAVARDQAEIGSRVTQMEQDMVTLKGKLADAKQKLKSLQSGRHPAAVAAERPERASPTERKVHRAMARFDRLQAQVESLEARVRSYELGGATTPVWGESPAPDPQVEDELNALKSRLNGKGGASAAGQAPAQAPGHNA